MITIKDFEGGFKKQLAYKNRTFLHGYYFYSSGIDKFEVVKNGNVLNFDRLEDAISCFNELSQEK